MERNAQVIWKTLLAGVMLCVAAYPALEMHWEASLFTGEATYFIAMPPSPVFQPPRAPSYLEFRQTYPEVPPVPAEQTISVRPDITLAFLQFSLSALVVFGVFALGASVVPALRQDAWAGFCAREFVSLLVSAGACFLLYVLIGGWGPPSPELFAMFGWLGGAIWHLTAQPRADAKAQSDFGRLC